MLHVGHPSVAILQYKTIIRHKNLFMIYVLVFLKNLAYKYFKGFYSFDSK